MQTLESLLRDRHGFGAQDFGPQRAEVRFDVRTGAINRWEDPGYPAMPPVAVGELVSEGQSLSFFPTPTLGRRVTLFVLAVNDDGLVALSPAGVVGFLPWEMLAYGLSHSATVEIEGAATGSDDLEAPGVGRRVLREEIAWLEAECMLHTRLAATAAARIGDLQAELAADDLNRALNRMD